jgi:hypothetical protein
MKNAPDVVRLTDNYPNGHYRESTHTAMGDEWDAEVRAAAEGKAKATCGDCHSRDLRAAHTAIAAKPGSPYGESVGCGECHNDVRSHGQAEVLAKWKARTCEDCHKLGTSAPMHATDEAPAIEASESVGCADTDSGCHEGADLHKLHADKPTSCSGSAKKGEPGCHKTGAEALLPTAKTCGGTGKDSCHRTDQSGTYTHKKARDAHAPSTWIAARATVDGVACGDCHYMAPDGHSLLNEHDRATSAHTIVPGDSCRNCHASPASADALADKWSAKSEAGACEACHGHAALPPVHAADVSGVHHSDSPGCGSTGPGCHPTSDLSSVGTPSTTGGIHSTCLRCHALSESDGNGTYDPARKTCGDGRACHSGGYDVARALHGGNDGMDAAHTAGAAQADDGYVDLATGLVTPCGDCHDMRLGPEHDRPNVSLPEAGNSCLGCHDAEGSPAVVKAEWPGRRGSAACASCHTGDEQVHAEANVVHAGTEIGPDGVSAPGSCVKDGCHGSLDLRKLHVSAGCALTGCHSASGDARGRSVTSCGGGNAFTSCHTGFSASGHFVSHDANVSGTLHGITYTAGSNVGCFGCHASDLTVEHARQLSAGSISGAANGCRVCHDETYATGVGPHASASSVRRAISKRDMRCTSCHASGTSSDTEDSVASPHRQLSDTTPLPVGRVWSDPFRDWRAAFEAPTGGGHNALSADLVGASAGKRFPLESLTVAGRTYIWALPSNEGTTTWLKASAFGLSSIETTEEISHLTVECSDCHAMPDDMAGPHGSSVHVGIDPDYSQTEYADPSRTGSQFEATGSHRVVCMKCHNMEAAGSATPGGNPVHTRHVSHADLPSSNKHHSGEACIDCHVRIPHAWKRPRLLVRTIETTDGASVDEYPYVEQDYDGLAGIVLRSFSAPSDLRSRSCATNGCHPGHSSTRHPLPSDIPTATYWP